MTMIAYDAQVFEDLRDAVSLIIDEDKNSVLDLFLVQDMAVKQVKHEWVNKKLKGYKDELNASINNSTTSVVVKDAANKFLVANKSYAQIGEEVVAISAVSTNTLTVTRGALGTSAAAHDADTEVFFFELEEEGADNSRDDSEHGSKAENYCQIFRRELKASKTSQAVLGVGGDQLIMTQADQKLRQLLQKLRSAFINNNASYADADESLRRMCGLPGFIAAANKIAMNGAPITEAVVEADIIKLLDDGANGNDLILLTGSIQCSYINQFKVSRVEGGGMSQSEKFIDNNVDVYKFADANVKIVRVPEMPKDRYIIGEKGKAKIAPLQKRSFAIEDISKKGDSDEKLIIGEYTCQVENGSDIWRMRTGLAS